MDGTTGAFRSHTSSGRVAVLNGHVRVGGIRVSPARLLALSRSTSVCPSAVASQHTAVGRKAASSYGHRRARSWLGPFNAYPLSSLPASSSRHVGIAINNGLGRASAASRITSGENLAATLRSDDRNLAEHDGFKSSSRIRIRPARELEYWAASDLHCRVFHPEEPSSVSWKALSLRVDRIAALQINDRLAEQGAGKSVLLLAFESRAAASFLPYQRGKGEEEAGQPDGSSIPPFRHSVSVSTSAAAASTAGPQQQQYLQQQTVWGAGRDEEEGRMQDRDEGDEDAAVDARLRAAAAAAAIPGSPTCADFPQPLFWLGGGLAPGVRPGVGAAAEALGLVGAASVDSFCDLVPPRELDWRVEGQLGWYRREGYAYVSNLAVLPSARRWGVARRLMAAAEAVAAGWGCRAAGLHCNPNKPAPWALYHGLGYRNSGVLEPPFMPYLQGRPPDRCAFLIKLLASPQQQQQGQQPQGQGQK